MIRALFSLVFFFSFGICAAQNFRGQWKGSFIDKSVSAYTWGGQVSDYVLDLEVQGNNVSGYSYTYFTDEGKKYYTICRLTGKADKKKKYLEITEIARTKTNVPNEISNSFQVHRLQWRKEGENEILEGKWDPAPGQRANTGYGNTKLVKRQLTEISPVAKRINSNKDPESSIVRSPFSKPLAKNLIAGKKPVITAATTKPTTNSKAIAKAPVKTPAKEQVKTPVKDTVAEMPEIKNPVTSSAASLPPDFEKRLNTVLQTVKIEGTTIKIELYDNGEVDGDSISLFYNNKIVLAHKRLCEKPIRLELPIDDEVNELVMYADNLGTIPPNTALLVAYDGNKRYELRMTSDLKKSGTIRFLKKN